MKINAALIKTFNPCQDRLDNFLQHYADFNGEFHEFLALENITYNDKVWVGCRLLTKNQLVQWSIFCAESVKHLFEAKYPDNKCLTELFDYLKSIEDFETLTEEQRESIAKLRRTAYAAASYAAYAADAAFYAAAYAAYAADAADAAFYAAAYAADAAFYAAAYAADAAAAAYDAADAAKEEQRNLNLLYLASLIQE
jgi:hypothetical protein